MQYSLDLGISVGDLGKVVRSTLKKLAPLWGARDRIARTVSRPVEHAPQAALQTDLRTYLCDSHGCPEWLPTLHTQSSGWARARCRASRFELFRKLTHSWNTVSQAMFKLRL